VTDESQSPGLSKGRKIILAAAAVFLLMGGFYGKSVWEERWMPPGPPEVAGKILMERKSCFRCHRITGQGGEVGPDLTTVAAREKAAAIDALLRDPRAMNPEGRMPRPKLTDQQRAAVVAYLMTLDGSRREPDPPNSHSGPR
jgi:cytochrome c551/c552